MSRLVKIVDNKYVQIEEYRNPNICFNTSEYDDFEDYCTLRETFDPFEMFYENQELKKQLEEQIATNEVLSHELTKDKILKQDHLTTCCGMSIKNVQKLINQQKEFIKYLEDESKEVYRYGGLRQNIFRQILQKYKEIIGDDK